MQGILGFDPGVHVFWMWLNFTGFFLTVAIAYIVSALKKDENNSKPDFGYELKVSDFMTKEPLILGGFFVAILTFCFFVPSIFG